MTTPPWFALPTTSSHPLNTQFLETPVIIVGAGLAGCHLAFALAQQNVPVLLLDAASTVAAGASSNDAGIVKPFVTRDTSAADQFYRAAFDYLLEQLSVNTPLAQHASFNPCGVLQLLNNPYPANASYASCTSMEASALAGVTLGCDAIHFSPAGWLNPAGLCHGLVQHKNIDLGLRTAVQSIRASNNGWLVDTQSRTTDNSSARMVERDKTLECHQLILATGECLNQFTQTSDIPVMPARGQTSRFRTIGENPLRAVITGKRYVIPHGHDLIVGASFKRGSINRDIQVDEHDQNRQALNELLPIIKISDTAVAGFSGIRATTPDRLPVLGPMPDLSSYPDDYALIKNGLPAARFPAASYHSGLSVIGGFGSRGIVSAPYCAKLLTDYLINNNGQQLAQWASLLHPGRFMVRTLKRA